MRETEKECFFLARRNEMNLVISGKQRAVSLFVPNLPQPTDAAVLILQFYGFSHHCGVG